MKRLGIVLTTLLVLALIIGSIGCRSDQPTPTPTPSPTPTPTVTLTQTQMPQGISPFAIAITYDGEYAFVSCDLSQVIFKVRLDNLTIEAVADLSDYYPLEVENIALDAIGEKLFVSANTWRKLIVLDTHTMMVIHTIDNIAVIGMTRSQYGPFIMTWDGGNTVTFINTDTYQLTEVDYPEFFLKIQESNRDSDLWYVVSGQGPGAPGVFNVGIYNHKTKAWSCKIPLLPQAAGVVVDLKVLPNENKAYVATFGGWYPEYHAYGWLYCVDLVGGGVKELPIDGGTLCLEASQDSRWVYVGTGWPMPNSNNLLVVDTNSDDIANKINLGRNKYNCPYTQMNDLQIDLAHPNLLYATNADGNAFIKVNLDNLKLVDVLVFNDESFRPYFFVRRPLEDYGYIIINQSAKTFKLNLDTAIIEGVLEFPRIREDAYDIAVDDTGRLLIAQGEKFIEVDADNMHLLDTHPLPRGIPSVWHFVLSNDQKNIYSISYASAGENVQADTFLAIDATNFEVKKSFKLEGGGFSFRPYELPDSSKLYVLGGQQNGPVVIHVIETKNYTIQKTITFNEPGLLGISTGSYYPFAYDSVSHTLFVGATQVVLAIDTDTDVIRKVIYLGDTARAIGLEPQQLTYCNATGLVFSPRENYLYIAHYDYSFVSIYDLQNNRFLPKLVALHGLMPSFMFANDDYSKIYCLNIRSDNVSVIDVKSEVEEKVIDLHSYQ